MSMKISSDLDINFSLQLLQNCQTVWNPAPGAVEKKRLNPVSFLQNSPDMSDSNTVDKY